MNCVCGILGFSGGLGLGFFTKRRLRRYLVTIFYDIKVVATKGIQGAVLNYRKLNHWTD